MLNSLSAAPGAPVPAPPPTRAELAALQRANLVESAKDRWNAEVEGAVRWVQTTDWDAVREGVEEGAGKLWDKVVGGSVEDTAGTVTRAAAQETRAKADEARSGIASAATRAVEQTRATTAKAVAAVEDKAVAAKTAVHRGIEKGKEAVGKAKAVVELAEERLESRAEAHLSPLSEVEKALRQRYESRDEVMKKSVKEVLDERYTPIAQRDNTVLRGL